MISVSHMTRRNLTTIALVVVTMIAAAILTLTVPPSSSWSRGDDTSGAPTGVRSDELLDARRATTAAASAAGFLTMSTGQLVSSVDKIDTKQINELSDGSQQLATGLTQLQAGVGQLGDGATQVANGIDQAVGPVIALNASRGQIVAAMDRTIKELEGETDPRIVEARKELISLRSQADSVPDDAIADLKKLQSGAREVANQLNVPGYAFHDGIYTATKGAGDLNTGIKQALPEATDAFADLQKGAKRIDTQANNTSQQIGAIGRALPSAQEESSSVLLPQIGVLIAALVMCIGLAAGVASTFLTRRGWLALLLGVLAAAITGLVALFILAVGLSVSAALISAGVMTLAALAAAGLGRVCMCAFGSRWGIGVAGVGALAQLAVVGWVWSVATTTEPAQWATALAGATPLHWATASLSSIGNHGALISLIAGAAVLAVISLVSLVGARRVRR